MIKMKRIVNGLLYDTEKAKVISKIERVTDRTYDYQLGIDFRTKWCEILYRTKRNRYFLLKQIQSLGRCSEYIVPITDEEAFDWLAEHDPDKAIELFPRKHIEEA